MKENLEKTAGTVSSPPVQKPMSSAEAIAMINEEREKSQISFRSVYKP